MGLDVAHACDAVERVDDESREMLKVAGANVQQVIGTACDDVGIGNFVQLRNRRDELVVPIVIALVYAHLHKGFDLVAQLGGVEQRMVATI